MTLSRRALLATATASGLLPRRLAAQTAQFDAALDRARGLEQLHSLIVLQNGEVQIAERLRGPALDQPANIKSVSKTIVATLTGIAIDNGVIADVTATIANLAADITVEDLVTLRAGLERTSGPNYGQWVSSPNWVANALGRPIIAEPGTTMLYSTGSTHILGAVLARATGKTLLTLAREWLGAPLSIDIPAWTRDRQGFYLGGNEMALSPRAMARFGDMIRQGGTWNGTRVVSQSWINRSFVPVTRSPWSGLGYGYGWFIGKASGHAYALARGYGGQIIAVVPDLALSIAITSDPTRVARSGGYFGDLQRLIEQDIISELV
jgi:CubicO group peptidase (beta-lactamase class C family)